jgi:hypothetical protein
LCATIADPTARQSETAAGNGRMRKVRLSLRSNLGLKLANAFGVFIPRQTDALLKNC